MTTRQDTKGRKCNANHAAGNIRTPSEDKDSKSLVSDEVYSERQRIHTQISGFDQIAVTLTAAGPFWPS